MRVLYGVPGRLSDVLIVLSFFLVINVITPATAKNVEEEFRAIVKAEKYVAAIFTKECCSCVDCVEAEALLASMSPELEDSLNVHLVKLVNQARLQKKYGISTLPTLLLLREGKPSLYDGSFELEAVQEWFTHNLESALKDLNDDNFEHLTQAATGATTGDWLVAFYSSSCSKQEVLQATLDGLAASLRNRINVAKVDTEVNPELVERFKIKACPTILFFHLGKFYQYDLPDVSIATLRKFAEGWYKNAKAEPVPMAESPFDKLTSYVALLIKENENIVIFGSLTAAALTAIFIFFSFRRPVKTAKKE